MKADIFTMRFINYSEWLHATQPVGIDISSLKRDISNMRSRQRSPKKPKNYAEEEIDNENHNPNVQHAYVCTPYSN